MTSPLRDGAQISRAGVLQFSPFQAGEVPVGSGQWAGYPRTLHPPPEGIQGLGWRPGCEASHALAMGPQRGPLATRECRVRQQHSTGADLTSPTWSWHGTTAALPRGFRAIRTKGDIFPPKMQVPFMKADHPLPCCMVLPAPLHRLPANQDSTGSPRSRSTGRGREKPCSTPSPCPQGRWGFVPGSLVYNFGCEPDWDLLESP